MPKVARTWQFQTEDETDDAIVGECLSREHEVDAYDTNVAKYETLLAGMPEDWTPDLEQYRHADMQKVAFVLDDDQYSRLARLRFKEELKARLRTEKAERDKSLAVLNVSKEMLPKNPARLNASLARVRVKFGG